jgi:hypothetical protein
MGLINICLLIYLAICLLVYLLNFKLNLLVGRIIQKKNLSSNFSGKILYQTFLILRSSFILSAFLLKNQRANAKKL